MSSNATIQLSHLNTIVDHLQVCWRTRVGAIYITGLSTINNLFLLPLCIFILYLGYQRWRQQRAGTAMSHSDLFTCHMVVIELINNFGCNLCCFGVYANVLEMVTVSLHCFSAVFNGQILFHILTSVERYLAVVHPIMYLNLRKAKGIRIRNIIIGCVWLHSLGGMSLMSYADYALISAVTFFSISFTLVIISFCSVSVLCALIRPGPGEGGRNQAKLRAFYTIMAIQGVLLLRFVPSVITNAVYHLQNTSDDYRCAVWLADIWFGFPCSLVLPLLFLQRAGKLSCCRSVNKSVQGSS